MSKNDERLQAAVERAKAWDLKSRPEISKAVAGTAAIVPGEQIARWGFACGLLSAQQDAERDPRWTCAECGSGASFTTIKYEAGDADMCCGNCGSTDVRESPQEAARALGDALDSLRAKQQDTDETWNAAVRDAVEYAVAAFDLPNCAYSSEEREAIRRLRALLRPTPHPASPHE